MGDNILKAIIELVLNIVERHTGPLPVTAEQVHAEAVAESASGKSKIIDWFLEKGLEPPE